MGGARPGGWWGGGAVPVTGPAGTERHHEHFVVDVFVVVDDAVTDTRGRGVVVCYSWVSHRAWSRSFGDRFSSVRKFVEDLVVSLDTEFDDESKRGFAFAGCGVIVGLWESWLLLRRIGEEEGW